MTTPLKKRNALHTLALAALLPLLAGADTLEPPDVDLFAELQYSQSDLRAFGEDHRAEGYRLRGGIWFNSLARHGLEFGLEAAFNQLVRNTRDTAFNRAPTAAELNNPPNGIGTLESVDVRAQDRLDISGYEIGGRIMHERLVYLRGGLLAYNIKTRFSEVLTYRGSSDDLTGPPFTDVDSVTGTGLYAGLGLHIPLVRDIALVIDASRYRIESENVDSFAAGVQLRF
ncbi:hypothetical protein [Isoalcanivorax indicus]|uniref:hypothetical protein n=1 Tax=Isoalcanivorax indicus TaxID=2202653 RepID=UPI000DBA2FF1|nr:hypothetical protein [Isoalcanivorax indicus]